MSSNAHFSAPWSASLKLLTSVSVVVLFGISLIGIFTGPEGNLYWILGMVVLPLLLLPVSAGFAILGYELDGQQLIVRRPGWRVRFDLTDLRAAEADPGAMLGSIRVFGNGGLFCFAGRFRNRQLGSYRALATDPKLAVVLRIGEKTVVISPDDPQRLVKALSPQPDQ